MSPKQTRRNYRGQRIDVSYDIRRCIHAAECVRGLPATFERQRIPWIEPDKSPAAEVAEVVVRCPSGALEFERKDAGLPEPIPKKNTVTLVPNGPLYVRGEIKIISAQGETRSIETLESLYADAATQATSRFAIIRTSQVGSSPVSRRSVSQTEMGPGETLQITPITNGPYQLLGNVEVIDPDQGSSSVGG